MIDAGYLAVAHTKQHQHQKLRNLIATAGFGQGPAEGDAGHLAAERQPLGNQEARYQVQDWLLRKGRQLQVDA